VYLAGMVMAFVVVASSEGYYLIGHGRWAFGDCLYMTIITLATVGYGETLDGMDRVPYARLWTVLVILCGSGILVYWVSSFTAVIVEGDLRGVLRRRRMDKAIANLSDHIILCGAGNTGEHAIRELVETKTPFVVLDHNEARLLELSEELGEQLVYHVGEATDDSALLAVGIARARGVLVMLHEDRDNLFCTLSCRALNSKVRIISKAVEHASVPKLMRAGADRAVSPNFIGGMRLASEMIRPAVVEFLDTMLRGDDRLRVEEVPVPEAASIVGKTLRNANLREQTKALVLAVRAPDLSYHFNPGPDFVINAGATLIIMAHMDEVLRLRKQVLEA
jgi:voltage-gated potassium channel